MESVGGFAEFLKYGALGLALACVIVLGFTVRSFYELVKDPNTTVERIAAARWIIYSQLAVFLLFGGGAVYLTTVELAQKRVAQVVIDPWGMQVSADALPVVRVCNTTYQGSRIIKVKCKTEGDSDAEINFQPYIDYVKKQAVADAIQTRQVLLPPTVDDSGV